MMWGLQKALVVSHATARVHHAAWRRGGNEHFATCGACLEAPEVERGNRYSALRMTAKGPGCMKSPSFNLRVEHLSQFHRYGNQLHWQPRSGDGN